MPSGELIDSIVRPSSYRDVLRQHLVFAIVSGCTLLAAYCLPLDKIPFRICFFFRLTGYPCPTCGWTRGFVSMADGNWPAAIHDCPLAAVLYMLTAVVFAWNTAALILGVNIRRGTALRLNRKRCMPVILLTLLLVLSNWFYRLAMGLK